MKVFALTILAIITFAIFQDCNPSKNLGSNNINSKLSNTVSTVKSSDAALEELKPNKFVNSKTPADSTECGTEAKPCQKIQTVLKNLNPTDGIDDVIQVAAGDYNENISMDFGGTNTDKIFLLGSIQDGTAKPKIISQATDIVSIRGNNITIAGFEITNGTFKENKKEKVESFGISVRSSSKTIKILNNDIHTIGMAYVEGNDYAGQADAVQVRNYDKNQISDVTIKDNKIYDMHLGRSEAITIGGNVVDAVVEGNEIRNVDNIAIDFSGGFDTCPVGAFCQASGKVINNKVSYAYADKNSKSQHQAELCKGPNQYNPGYPDDGAHTMGGIYVDGGTDVLIERNKVWCSGTGIDFGSEKGLPIDKILVLNNVVYHNYSAGVKLGGYDPKQAPVANTFVRNSVIANNTFIDNEQDLKPKDLNDEKGTIYFEYKDPDFFQNITISNNLVFDNDARALMANVRQSNSKKVTKTKAKFSNNLFFSTKKEIFTNNNGGFSDFTLEWFGGDQNEFLTPVQYNSIFVNNSKYDFELSKNSYAIDKGLNADFPNCQNGKPCIDFSGNPRIVNYKLDIGAFEFQNAK